MVNLLENYLQLPALLQVLALHTWMQCTEASDIAMRLERIRHTWLCQATGIRDVNVLEGDVVEVDWFVTDILDNDIILLLAACGRRSAGCLSLTPAITAS